MTKLKEEVAKQFGDEVILSGNSLVDKKVLTIPVGPALDIILNGGIPEGSFVILTGQPKSGKSQRLTDLIYTPNGPTTIGQIKVGDIISNPDGKTSSVVGIYPQGEKDIYKVKFNDGSSTYCGLEHNWTVSKNNRQTNYVTMTLEEILHEGLRYNDRWKWKIPITKPVYFKQKKKLAIDPYILGCLIGDGNITGKTPKLTSSDNHIVNIFKNFCKVRGLSFKHITKHDYCISGNFGGGLMVKNSLTKNLKSLNLMGCSSHTKFIPSQYKYSSTNNRWKLIRGLMDTDGYNNLGKIAEYTTVSKKLSKDVQELVESLGYTCKIVKRLTGYAGVNGKMFPSYRLHIKGNDIDKLFSLPRKKSGHKRTRPNLFRTIVDIKKVGKEEAVCIEVDSLDGLYLTNNFIVTHNTTTSLDFAATAQKQEYAHGSFKDGRQVYYLNIEGRLKKRDLEGIPGLDLNRFHIIGSQQGKILHAEEYLQIAEKIINEVPGSVVIIDSYSALCTEAEITSDMDKMQRADGAKLLAKFCRKVANVIPVNQNIVIGITHLMGNPTGYGAEFKEKSGQAIAYQTDVKLRVKTFKPWTLSSDNTQIGQEVEWQVICSSLGPPGGIITSYIRYGQGIDRHTEIINLASDLGIINKGGAWYTITSLEDKPKFQGVEKVRTYLVDNPKVYESLYSQVKETMGIK
jgi:RecA/RadA recombinase